MSDVADRNAVLEMICDVICGEGVRCDISCSTIDLVKEILSEEPKTGKWIPVTERLPKETGLYLVTLKTAGINAFEGTHPNGFVYIALWDGISMRWGYNDKYVTAWMPLPEPFRREDG
jgi:hypothetical protein